jgi:hypothetical protein
MRDCRLYGHGDGIPANETYSAPTLVEEVEESFTAFANANSSLAIRASCYSNRTACSATSLELPQ